MSDHAVLTLILVIGFAVQIGGLVILGLQLRDSRRMTRAMEALVEDAMDLWRAEQAEAEARAQNEAPLDWADVRRDLDNPRPSTPTGQSSAPETPPVPPA